MYHAEYWDRGTGPFKSWIEGPLNSTFKDLNSLKMKVYKHFSVKPEKKYPVGIFENSFDLFLVVVGPGHEWKNASEFSDPATPQIMWDELLLYDPNLLILV